MEGNTNGHVIAGARSTGVVEDPGMYGRSLDGEFNTLGKAHRNDDAALDVSIGASNRFA